MASAEAFHGDHHCIVFGTEDHGANLRSFLNCKTNPGHDKFMTIREFQQNEAINAILGSDVATVQYVIDRCVRVIVRSTSKRRPDTYPSSDKPYPLREHRGNTCLTRYGTGFLCDIDQVQIQNKHVDIIMGEERRHQQCPCLHCCKSGGKNKSSTDTKVVSKPAFSAYSVDMKGVSKPTFSAYFVVVTATHVLFDSSEAEKAVFELFYDTEEEENRNNVECLYGVCVLEDEREERLETDKCRVLCVTHDSRLAEKLCDMVRQGVMGQASRPLPPSPFLVSHPHGVSKRISFGEIIGAKCFLVAEHASPVTMKKGLKVRMTSRLDDDDNDNNKAFRKMSRLKCKDDAVADSPAAAADDDDDDDDDDNDDKDDDEEDENSSSGKNIDTHTFKLSCDLTVCSPLPVAIHYCVDPLQNYKYPWNFNMHAKDKWWTLPPGLKVMVAKGGKSKTRLITLPRNTPDKNKNVAVEINNAIKLEAYVKGYWCQTPFLLCHRNTDNTDDDTVTDNQTDTDTNPKTATATDTIVTKTATVTTNTCEASLLGWDCHRYYQYTHNMAACPGSSGALVPNRNGYGYLIGTGATHFGCVGCGGENEYASGLTRF